MEVRETEQVSERFLASLAKGGSDEYPAVTSKISTYSSLLALAMPEY
jgi:hypothetical protein